jgi:hypothetical protein
MVAAPHRSSDAGLPSTSYFSMRAGELTTCRQVTSRSRFARFFHDEADNSVDLIASLVGIISFILWAASTYTKLPGLFEMSDSVFGLELLLSLICLLVVVLRSYADGLGYMLTWTCWLATFFTAPLFVYLYILCAAAASRQGITDTFRLYFQIPTVLEIITIARFLRVLNVIHILRLLRMWLGHRGTSFHIAQLLMHLFSLAIFACGIVQILEKNAGTAFTFDEVLYFVFTVLSTVGFGDFTAITVPGRYFVIFLMLIGLTIVPLTTQVRMLL